MYTSGDIDNLIDRAEREGRAQDDPNFPGVARLRKYTFAQEMSGRVRNAQVDTQGVQNNGEISHAEARELVAEGAGYV